MSQIAQGSTGRPADTSRDAPRSLGRAEALSRREAAPQGPPSCDPYNEEKPVKTKSKIKAGGYAIRGA